jgi:hypothetical protein
MKFIQRLTWAQELIKHYKQYKNQTSKSANIKLNMFSNNVSAARQFLPSGFFLSLLHDIDLLKPTSNFT